jgi:iron complex transport system substrate-binding protein
MTLPPSETLRIVSLLPSATEILTCLGLGDRIVGRSHECDYPPDMGDRPICTASSIDTQKSSAAIDADVQAMAQKALSLYTVKLNVLEDLHPTHIVTQDQCDVCAVNFTEVEKAVSQLLHSHPTIISLQPHTLEDVWIDIQRVADAFGVDAGPVLKGLQHRVKVCQQQTESLGVTERPTVATLEWLDPLMGSGNWIPELVEYAGGRDCFGTVGEPSPYISWEDLQRQDPDVIVVLPCGFDLSRTRQELRALYEQPHWQALKAAQTHRLYLADGNAYFNRPGPRLVDSLEILTEILHPELVESRYAGKAWERMSSVNA